MHLCASGLWHLLWKTGSWSDLCLSGTGKARFCASSTVLRRPRIRVDGTENKGLKCDLVRTPDETLPNSLTFPFQEPEKTKLPFRNGGYDRFQRAIFIHSACLTL